MSVYVKTATGLKQAATAAGTPAAQYKSAWVSGTTYAINDYVTNGGAVYRRKVAGAGATVPGSDATNWELMVPAARSVTTIARTAGTGAAGTTDTYTITYSDSTTSTFPVYNGSNGTGAVNTVNGVAPTGNNVDVSRIKAAGQSPTGGVLAQWTRVLTASLPGTAHRIHSRVLVNTENTGFPFGGAYAVVNLNVVQAGAAPGTQQVSAQIEDALWLTPEDFKVVVTSTAGPVVVELWVRAVASGLHYEFFELGGSGSQTPTFETAGTWAAALPAGTAYPVTQKAILTNSTGQTNTGKIFRDICQIKNSVNSAGSTLLIRTNITYGATMTKLRLRGYNYTAPNQIDLDVSFYAFLSGGTTPTFPTHGWQSNGSMPVTSVTPYVDANNKVVLAVLFGQTLDYAHLNISELWLGYNQAADSMAAGWALEISTDLTGLTALTSPTTIARTGQQINGTILGSGPGANGSIGDGAAGSITPALFTSQTSGKSAVAAVVNDGTRNRRAGVFVNDTDGLWGLNLSWSNNGIAPFVIGTGNGVEWLRINTGGNVGIGTPNPTARVHVIPPAASTALQAQGAFASATISNKALASNVATLTTTAPHGFVAGKWVSIASVDATFNGLYQILATPTTTTFTYAKVAADVASVAATGTAVADVQTGDLLRLYDGASRLLMSVGPTGAVGTLPEIVVPVVARPIGYAGNQGLAGFTATTKQITGGDGNPVYMWETTFGLAADSGGSPRAGIKNVLRNFADGSIANNLEPLSIGLATGFVGFGTTAPTHTITLPSTSTQGYAHYNTADQTTNYERGRVFWSGNVFTLATEQGGTGASRTLRLDAGGTKVSVIGSSNVEVRRDATSIGTLFNVTSTGLSAGAGSQSAVLIDPTINQSGAAGYSAIRVNVTETATGSGSKRLLDLAVANVIMAYIDNAGILSLNGPASRVQVNQASSAANGVYHAAVSGDTATRYAVQADGKITWGPGNAAGDTNLYRNAAGSLKTDGAVLMGGSSSIAMPLIGNDTSVPMFSVYGGADGTLGPLAMQFGSHPSATGGNRFSYISSGDAGAMRALALNTNGSGAYGNVALYATNATHALTMGSGGSGYAHYNTTDQTTNFERGRIAWGSNSFTITTEYAGTGTPRDLVLTSVGSAKLTLFALGNDAIVARKDGSTTPNLFRVSSTGLSASTGTQTGLLVDPTINQSSTAGYVGLNVDVTETATGSGTKRLIRAGVAGATKWYVQNNGAMVQIVDSAGVNPFVTSVAGDTANRLVIDSNAKFSWGPGNAATDTNLYRSSAAVLKTDQNFHGYQLFEHVSGSAVRVYSPNNKPTAADVGLTNAVIRVVYTAGAWPARPAGAACVEWVGPAQPTTGMVAGDTFVKV